MISWLQFVMADANQLADTLGVMPLYKQKETARWSSAVHLYQEMLSNANSENASPEEPRTPEGTPEMDSLLAPLRENPAGQPIGNSRSLTNLGLVFSPPNASCPSFPVSRSGHFLPGCLTPAGQMTNWSAILMNRRGSQGQLSPGEASQNSLELEAVAAVHELSFAVEAIWVSDMLPRTPDLIFVNVTTVEQQPVCLELTIKGWRVTSLRHDCMNGDIDHLDLHIQYFETIYALMDQISEGYRNRFSEALAARLRQLELHNSLDPASINRKMGLRANWSDGLLSKVLKEEDSARTSQESTDTLKGGSEPISIPGTSKGQKTADDAGNLAVKVQVTVRHPSGEGSLKQEFSTPTGTPRPIFEF